MERSSVATFTRFRSPPDTPRTYALCVGHHRVGPGPQPSHRARCPASPRVTLIFLMAARHSPRQAHARLASAAQDGPPWLRPLTPMNVSRHLASPSSLITASTRAAFSAADTECGRRMRAAKSASGRCRERQWWAAVRRIVGGTRRLSAPTVQGPRPVSDAVTVCWPAVTVGWSPPSVSNTVRFGNSASSCAGSGSDRCAGRGGTPANAPLP